MKKHMTPLLKQKPEELKKLEKVLILEVTELSRGVKTGDTPNYKSLGLKKRELARVKMLIAQMDGSDISALKSKTQNVDVKPTKKEKK